MLESLYFPASASSSYKCDTDLLQPALLALSNSSTFAFYFLFFCSYCIYGYQEKSKYYGRIRFLF